MATADLYFDAPTFRYPECPGGLSQLTEQVTLGNFVLEFESMNENIKLTRNQLEECWLYAVHSEYDKVLRNAANMTRDEVREADRLLSQGIGQVGDFDVGKV